MIETRLLLVDDEDAFASAMEKRLTHRNMKVSVTLSGEEALSALDQDPDIDVVLLDIKMPGMDGIAALREMKRNHPLVEVIMLTGHATVESAIDGMKLGAFDYLMKPGDIETLVKKVQEAKEKKRDQERRIMDATGKELRRRRGV